MSEQVSSASRLTMTANPFPASASHSGYVGLFSPSQYLPTNGDEPRSVTVRVTTGNPSVLWPASRKPETIRAQGLRSSLRGTGSSPIVQQSSLLAHSEALERYCTSMFSEEQFVIASADELGSEALDMGSIPKCSRAELAHPKCPLISADKTR